MNRISIYLLISLYFGAIAFATTNSLIIGLAVLCFYFLIFIIFIRPLVNKYQERNRKRHEVFHFINHFIISLSVTVSLEQAFSDSTIDVKGEEKEVIDSIEMMTVPEKLGYLSQYFESDLYRVFLSIVNLHEEEGGDLLDSASPLLEESTLEEEKFNSLETIRKKSLVQFGSMWFLSSLILAFLRFGLASFYKTLCTNIPYLLTAAAYFLIAILSFYIYARVVSGEKQIYVRRENHVKKES